MADDFAADIAAIESIPAMPIILEVVCRTTGMGFAAVARVTADRWIACSVRDTIDFGLKPGGELKVKTTICDEIRLSGEAVIIDHVAEDAHWRAHHTPLLYGFQSYISMPIVLADGSFFGTLCAIDPQPASLNNPETIGMFKLFAELIAFHLDAHERVVANQALLDKARRTAELRDQFIAVLAHDLRNPLASIDAGAKLLAKTPLDERASTIVDMVHGSVRRMARLIDDTLDLARGRLGGGIPLHRAPTDLAPVLTQVVDELRAGATERVIDAQFDLEGPVDCDPARIGQLLSNLLSNALTHGDPRAPVRVRARTDRRAFELSVANSGPAIPAGAREKLFEPFVRGNDAGPTGLGLGLYIASEVARAHGGTLTVASSAKETRFTFRLPKR